MASDRLTRELLNALFPKQPLTRVAQTLGISRTTLAGWLNGDSVGKRTLVRLVDYDAREVFERIARWKKREHRRVEAEGEVMRVEAERAIVALRLLVARDGRLQGEHGKPWRSPAQAANAKRLGERRREEVRRMREARGEDWFAASDEGT